MPRKVSDCASAAIRLHGRIQALCLKGGRPLSPQETEFMTLLKSLTDAQFAEFVRLVAEDHARQKAD